jgi:hypothetical protein
VYRPHPGTKYRPIFNWAHWFVGNSAFILGKNLGIGIVSRALNRLELLHEDTGTSKYRDRYDGYLSLFSFELVAIL